MHVTNEKNEYFKDFFIIVKVQVLFCSILIDNLVGAIVKYSYNYTKLYNLNNSLFDCYGLKLLLDAVLNKEDSSYDESVRR